MRIKNILSSFVICIGVLTFIASYVPWKFTIADQTEHTVDISTTPSSGFLIAENMAPGEEKSAEITINNNGDLDFNYSVSTRQEAGDQDIYNLVQLVVTDNNGKLYEGLLNGLQNFPLGTIAPGANSTLTFTTKLPVESGNEYQEKATFIAFDFIAENHDHYLDTCFEPPFSNSNFTLHQNSTVPIKFHLRNAAGDVETTARNNVRLEVTGPGVESDSVRYVFQQSNGTLKFEGKLDEPHYLARFSTFDYPVVTGGEYKATVYDGDKIICQKSFIVSDQGNRSNSH